MGQKYEYIAVETIEVPPGSGLAAFAAGQYVPAESVESLGIRDKVRPANPDVPTTSRTPPHNPPTSS